jgi:hypothetical protein
VRTEAGEAVAHPACNTTKNVLCEVRFEAEEIVEHRAKPDGSFNTVAAAVWRTRG